jgi:2-iminobutanoate/2-iminopropanoate deaminase
MGDRSSGGRVRPCGLTYPVGRASGPRHFMSRPEQINVASAPRPLGAYSHAIRVGELLFISGQGARDPKTGELVSPSQNSSGQYAGYDIRAHTRACIENVKTVVESAGGSLKDVVDVTVLLINMKDFAAFNEVYEQYFREARPARTTMAVAELPLQNVIEIKAIAYLKSGA